MMATNAVTLAPVFYNYIPLCSWPFVVNQSFPQAEKKK